MFSFKKSRILIASILLMLISVWPAASHDMVEEGAVKAAILRNLLKFVDWQTGTPPGQDNPLMVGVIGHDSVQERLVSIEVGATQRPLIAIVTLKDLRQLSAQKERLHVLYIARSAQKLTPEILDVVANSPILTISDDEKFVGCGGIMNFARENNRIRFDINLTAAEGSHLKLSARLFGLARRIIKHEAGRQSL